MHVKSYPQKFSEHIPFASLSERAAALLRQPKPQHFLAHALLEVASGFDHRRVDMLVQVAKEYVLPLRAYGRRGIAAPGCIVDVMIEGNRTEVEEYTRLREYLSEETQGKINGETGAVCLAYWLHDHTHKSIVEYLREGFLSETAYNDILTMAADGEIDPQKRGQPVGALEIRNEAETMGSEQPHKKVRLEFLGTLEMSAVEKEFHRAQMGKYRDRLAKGEKPKISPKEAISLVEQRIKALD